MLLDVLLDVEIPALCFHEFLLDEAPNLDWACTGFACKLFEGRGGGIRALAAVCLHGKNWCQKKCSFSFLNNKKIKIKIADI